VDVSIGRGCERERWREEEKRRGREEERKRRGREEERKRRGRAFDYAQAEREKGN